MYKISILPEEIDKLPRLSFPGYIEVIDKVDFRYYRAIAYLSRQKIIGFDTETRPVFTPGAPHRKVALLQLSGPDKAFLFRISIIGMRTALCHILASEKIVKVGAAVADDVKGLKSYRSFEAGGFVDLQKIGYLWGIRDKSVKKMAAIILEGRVSKSQQLSNWEADTLSEGQQLYAATDAWVCREMYLRLLNSPKHPLSEEDLNPKPVQND